MAEIKTLAKRAVEVRDLVTKYIPEIRKAVPKGIDAMRLARIALTLLPNNPALLQCDSKSLLGGVLQASAWGLELDPVLGLAYLIPYGQKAQLIIGYQGLMELARRSGDVKRIYARVVYQNDEFEYELGLDEKLKHIPADDDKRGEIRGVYGVAVLADGTKAFEYMSAADVEKIRNRSRAKDSGPWITDREMMYRKTVIRRLLKYQSRSVEVSRAIALDEKVDIGLDQDLHESFSVIDVESEEAKQDQGKSSLDKLAAALPGKKDPPPAAQKGQPAPENVDTNTGEITNAPPAGEQQQENAPPPAQDAAQAPQTEPAPQGDYSPEPAAREEAPEPATTKAEIAAVENQQKKAEPAPRPIQPPPNQRRQRQAPVSDLQERANALAQKAAARQQAKPTPPAQPTLPTANEIPFGDAPGPGREPGEEG